MPRFWIVAMLLLLFPLSIQAQPLVRPEQLRPSVVLPYSYSTLPSVVTANKGRLAQLTDNSRDLWVQGDQWFSVGHGFNDVRAFNAKGDGVTEDTTAVNAALARGGIVYFPTGTYLVNTLTVASNTHITGPRDAVIQLKNSANAAVFSLGTSSHVVVSGITIDGNRANQSPTCNGTVDDCYGISSGSGNHLWIDNVTFRNVLGRAVAFGSSSWLSVTNSFFTNVGSGVTFTGTDGGKFVKVTSNFVEGADKYGVGFGTFIEDAVIANNVLYDCSRTGADQAIVFYSDSNKRTVVANNVVRKVTLHGGIRIGGENIIIEGNLIDNVINQALFVSTLNTPDGRVHGAIVSNNIVLDGAGGTVTHGIDALRCDGCTIAGNHVELDPASQASCVFITGGTGNTIANNYCSGGLTGLRINSELGLVVSNNNVTAATVRGIYITEADTLTDRIIVEGNNVHDLNAAAVAGILIDGTNVAVINNIVTGVINGEPINVENQATNLCRGNIVPLATCSVLASATPGINDVRCPCDLLTVTGNSAITSLLAGPKGHCRQFRLTGNATFTDGSNLLLAGDLVGSADDTITLCSDGTNWIETSRSVN